MAQTLGQEFDAVEAEIQKAREDLTEALEKRTRLRIKMLASVNKTSVPLSRREIDIVGLLNQKKTNKEIANALNISERTVKFHVGNILRKAEVGTRTAFF